MLLCHSHWPQHVYEILDCILKVDSVLHSVIGVVRQCGWSVGVSTHSAYSFIWMPVSLICVVLFVKKLASPDKNTYVVPIISVDASLVTKLNSLVIHEKRTFVFFVLGTRTMRECQC